MAQTLQTLSPVTKGSAIEKSQETISHQTLASPCRSVDERKGGKERKECGQQTASAHAQVSLRVEGVRTSAVSSLSLTVDG